MDLARGQTVGQYRIVRRIGEGGMLADFKTDHCSRARSSSRFWDLPSPSTPTGAVASAASPTRSCGSHIPTASQHATKAKSIVMRYLTGASLHERRQSTDFGRADPLRLLDQMAQALDFAHGG